MRSWTPHSSAPASISRCRVSSLEGSEQTDPGIESGEPLAPTVRRQWHRDLKRAPRAAELRAAKALLEERRRPFGELGPTSLCEAIEALRAGRMKPPSQLVFWD